MDTKTTKQGEGGQGERSLRELGEHVRDDLMELREAASQRREELLAEVRGRIDEHPLAAVGIAFAAGYLLSGALLSRLTMRVAVFGARWYLTRTMKELLGGALVPAEEMDTEALGGDADEHTTNHTE